MPTAVEYLLHIDGVTTDTDTVDTPFESYSFSAANSAPSPLATPPAFAARRPPAGFSNSGFARSHSGAPKQTSQAPQLSHLGVSPKWRQICR